jgi:hypothetical protein
MFPTIDAMGSARVLSSWVERVYLMSESSAAFGLCDKQVYLWKGISAGQRLNSMGP